MKRQKLRINGIIEESVVDGPGIRYTIFVQGCPHQCIGCHNPGTHSFDAGYEVCVDELLSAIMENPILSGITFSGGEPMCQATALCAIAEKINEVGLDIAIYTGYIFEELLEENNHERIRLLSLCNVLIDGKFEEDKRDGELLFKGSSNQRILDLKQSMERKLAIEIVKPPWTK